jgi:N-acetylglucosaminyl-diphospho-decaprenol L-rhamnosyltransferase
LKESNPVVSVVVLSYNRPAYLQEALESLCGQSYEKLEIIVVDNPSPASAEVARVVGQYENALLIRNKLNQGYAAGMNTGIAAATGQYVHLTEDDIVLDGDCIRKLVEYLNEHAEADLIAPIIYNKTERTIRCAGGELTLGGVYRRKIYGEGEQDTGQFPQPFDVKYIDGATMFARKGFWQQFKGFREEYFMYVEAVELCARVGKSGKRMMIVPQAKVYHFEPTQAATTPEIEFHKVKNFFSLYLLHAPARHLPEFVCRYAVINTVRTLLGRTGSQPRTFLKALWWVAKKTPALLRERYAQAQLVNSEK